MVLSWDLTGAQSVLDYSFPSVKSIVEQVACDGLYHMRGQSKLDPIVSVCVTSESVPRHSRDSIDVKTVK